MSAEASLRFNVLRLDDRPPFVDLRLMESAQRLRIQSVARWQDVPEGGQFLLHGGIGKGFRNRGIEFRDDLPRRSLGGPKPVPKREIELGHAGLGGRWNIRRC